MRRAGLLAIPLLWLCLGLLAAPAAWGDDDAAVRVRSGDHPGFGRVVFDFPERVVFRLTREGDRVRLRFDGAGRIGSASSRARNVQRIIGGDGQADIVVSPATTIHPWRLGNGVVIDVLDPEPEVAAGAAPPSGAAAPPSPPDKSTAPAPAAAHPADVASAPAHPPLPAPEGGRPANAASVAMQTAEAGPAALSPGLSRQEPPTPPTPSPVPGPPSSGPPSSGQPSSAQPSSVRQASDQRKPPQDLLRPDLARPPAPAGVAGPLALVVTRAALPPGVVGSAISLPFGSTTGLAAFRRGDTALLVFDEARPLDLAALRGDRVFGSAAVQLLPTATVIRFRPPAGTELAVARTPNGWTVTAGAAASPVEAIGPVLADRRLDFATAAPGAVVSISDPDTGGIVLVGTLRQPGQGVPVSRRTSEFVLLPTWQGIAVEPLSDKILLRVVQNGFQLTAAPAGLALAASPPDAAAYAGATGMTRRYDLPPLPTASLLRQLQSEIDAAAMAPPLARAPSRRAAAQTMVALGLGAEAQAMLRLAAAGDAREADDPDAIGLGAIAALLAGRDDEADGLSDPRLTGTDEIALWRAVREARQHEGSPAAASVFAATLPLLLSYPAELRGRLLPLVAETMALNKSEGVDALFSSHPDDRSLALARGIWLQAKGDKDGALAIFDRLAAGADRLARVRAAPRAVELRLSTGAIDAKQAADALEKQFYAWRGDQHELALRERVAELRSQSGNWRAALALLRETETLAPDDQPAIHERLKELFAAFLADHDADRQSPFDLVALVDENADLLPDGAQGAELAARLADRLLALDLPKRADPVLAKLVQSSAGAARAGFGLRLASSRLREGNADGALAALSASGADELPAELVEQRVLVQARALARRGDQGTAIALLEAAGSAEADAARADILEEARDWREAEHALADYAGKTVPATGPLNDTQRRTLLRLAGATAQAGDPAALAALRQREGQRMAGGSLGDMFRLLTSGPIQGSADISRAGREIALARGIPTDLKAMTPARSSP